MDEKYAFQCYAKKEYIQGVFLDQLFAAFRLFSGS